jgi:adenine-specific DNA-methyltransferase
MIDNLKKSRGQFFTTKNRVLDVLISLIKNDGSVLEPSAGEGHIVLEIEKKLNRNVLSVELDVDKVNSKVCKSEISVDNFFNFIKACGTFDSIVGNPPFVKLKNVEQDTIDLLPEKIPGNGNLYYFFIKYCVNLLSDGGELVFIVPKEWLYNVSSQFVRDFLKDNGSFTHFIDCGEEKLFDDADVPALCIFRYVKNYVGDVKYYETLDDYNVDKFINKKVIYSNTISFCYEISTGKTISDFFDVKVGLVSGAEKIYKLNDNINLPEDSVIQIVGTDKELSNYLFVDNYNTFEELSDEVKQYLLPNKKKLINRKISNFTEKNWWKYGALRNFKLMKSDKKRIYCLMKTRNTELFWLGNENEFFGGGIIGLFLKDNIDINLDNAVNFLNSNDFREIMKENNMCSNNKVSITPSVLSSLPFTNLDN